MKRPLLELSAAEAARELSIHRLRGVLIAFVAAIVLVGSLLATLLVYGVFAELNAAVEADLRWKAGRGARDLAGRSDAAIALGDARMILDALADYRDVDDVAAISVVDPQGNLLAVHGATAVPVAELFAAAEGELRENAHEVWAWAGARIEGQEVGRLAVVISKQRLTAGLRLRDRLILLAAIACVVGIGVSLLFVRLYLAPVLRVTEATLDKLRELNETLEQRVAERTVALSQANVELARSLEDLNATQALLVDASRRAGMADVATNVLHNVGNVLNSVNVSSEVLLEMVRRSATVNLDKTASLLREQGDRVGEFLASDVRGRKVAPFVIALAEAVSKERARMQVELEALRENVDHIKNIISRQQELARARHGMVERVPVHNVLDAVMKMVQPSFEKRGIELVPDYPLDEARVAIDRHKLVEVLMNLLTNARQAVENQPGPRRVVVAARREARRVLVTVSDNGSGIAAEHLERVFEQGFTTKKKGHGFGLHGSACHMMEMGGSLRADSDGPGRGATFTVELPLPADSEVPLTRTTQELLAVR